MAREADLEEGGLLTATRVRVESLFDRHGLHPNTHGDVGIIAYQRGGWAWPFGRANRSCKTPDAN